MNKMRPLGESAFNDSQGRPLADGQMINTALRASVVFALRVYNTKALENQLNVHIRMALNLRTVGEMRRLVADVDKRLAHRH